MINVWGIKTISMAFWSAFSHKKEWGHLLERIHYTSRYSITQELLQFLEEFITETSPYSFGIFRKVSLYNGFMTI